MMKNTEENTTSACDLKSNSKIRDIWKRQVSRVKKGSFTCPFCREAFTGLGAFGAHLKDHCT